jgi:hypothetical protein
VAAFLEFMPVLPPCADAGGGGGLGGGGGGGVRFTHSSDSSSSNIISRSSSTIVGAAVADQKNESSAPLTRTVIFWSCFGSQFLICLVLLLCYSLVLISMVLLFSG